MSRKIGKGDSEPSGEFRRGGARAPAWAVAPGIGSVAQWNDDVKDREGGRERSARLSVYKGATSAGSRPVRRRNAAAGRSGCLRRGSRRGESIRVGSVPYLLSCALRSPCDFIVWVRRVADPEKTELKFMIHWLETHENLSGWAQFAGAMVALVVTYCTAFAPAWRRNRQLSDAGNRLLANGYKVISSYQRALENFAPFPQSIQMASLTMSAVVEEICRYPIFEIDDSAASMSVARRLATMKLVLGTTQLHLDELAREIQGRHATPEEHDTLKAIVEERLAFARALVLGTPMERPVWPSENR